MTEANVTVTGPIAAGDPVDMLSPTENYAEDIVVLTDEDGKEHEFQVVDIIEVEMPAGSGIHKEYALLLPADSEDPEQDEVLVLRLEEDHFDMIEDKAEFEAVVKVLEALNADED